MTQPRRSALARLGAIAALTVALVATCASAYAGPSIGPTLGTNELQALIEENGGTLDAHLLTVLKGSTVTEIPIEIEAVTGGFSDGPPELAALILFRGTPGSVLDDIGGIASGMSGSPIYVEAGQGSLTQDTLVGALSYGDWFTKDNYGLATPIDAMTAIEGYPSMSATSLRALDEPVIIEGQVVNNIVVTEDPSGFEKAADNGTFVARPLAAQYLGGLSPSSKLYQAYKKHVESHGGSLVPLAHGLSSMESTYNAPFAPGSGIAALAARGDLWAGGVGTVTYVNGDNVLAFGHPMNYEGKTGLFMSNAWVDGIWRSNITPYKIARPAALRGRLTQDRGAGIMGIDGAATPKASVNATVTYTDGAYSKVGTSTTEIPSFAINNAGWTYQGLAPVAAYLAAAHAIDSSGPKGSALTTTTVVVDDAGDALPAFTIVKRNVFDSSYDIAGAAMRDVDSIVWELQQLGDNGIAHPNIISVNLEAAITPARRYAQIVDVDVTGGLRTGDNTATVSLLQWGVEATQTVEAPFTIPTGVPLTGDLTAGDFYMDGGDEEYIDEEMYYFGDDDSAIDRRKTEKVVADIQAELPNNALRVAYQPVDRFTDLDSLFSDGDRDEVTPPKPKIYKPIEVTKNLDYVVTGGARKSAPKMELRVLDLQRLQVANTATISYGQRGTIVGELLGTEEPSQITVTRLYAGSSAPSAAATITYEPDEDPFIYNAWGLTRNATFTFSYSGDEDTLATQGSIAIKVRASTSLSASSYRFKRGRTTTLRASVAPTSATGKVVFERYSGGWWYSIGTRTLVGGKASLSYKPSRTGTYKVRARYVPGTDSTNAAGNSSTRILKVIR